MQNYVTVLLIFFRHTRSKISMHIIINISHLIYSLNFHLQEESAPSTIVIFRRWWQNICRLKGGSADEGDVCQVHGLCVDFDGARQETSKIVQIPEKYISVNNINVTKKNRSWSMNSNYIETKPNYCKNQSNHIILLCIQIILLQQWSHEI